MKKQIFLSLLLCSSFLAHAQWKITNLLTPRSEMAGIYAGGLAFFAGGNEKLTPKTVVSKAVDIYDVNTGAWTAAQLSVAREYIAVAAVGNKVMFAGGRIIDSTGTSYYLDIVDVYNLDTKTWSVLKMPEKRYRMKAVTVEDKVYFVGGRDYLYRSEIFVYDDKNNTWSTLTLPGQARSNIGLTAVGKKIFVAGGASSSTLALTTVDMYDIDTKTWSSPGELSSERELVEAISVGNKAYFIGGLSGITPSEDMDIYDPATNKWELSYNSPMYNAAVCVANKKIYVGGGGFLNPDVSGMNVFDIQTGKWQFPKLNYPVSGPFFKQTGISTPKGIMVGGGETNTVGYIEKRVFILDVVSLVQEPKPEQLEAYPTPANDMVSIRLDQSEDIGKLNATLLDLCGRSHAVALHPGQDAHTCMAAVSHLPPGHYILQLRSDTRLYAGKIIKQ